jgi:hypothetical protein
MSKSLLVLGKPQAAVHSRIHVMGKELTQSAPRTILKASCDTYVNESILNASAFVILVTS